MGLIRRILYAPHVMRFMGRAAGRLPDLFAEDTDITATSSGQDMQQDPSRVNRKQTPVPRRFDSVIDGINRLPRPALALGTFGLFGYAMIDPAGFAVRMQALALMPDPLWMLAGAIVSFCFGARELHHRRLNRTESISYDKHQRLSASAPPQER